MNLSDQVVSALLGEARPKPVPVRIRRSSGDVVNAEFNGYWDLRSMGRGMVPSVGYVLPNGNISHGVLGRNDEILTPIPSPEEWSAMETGSVEAPQKATFWASSGSGAY